MDNLIINQDGTEVVVPIIHLNASTAVCTIKGESYLEEPFQVYGQVLEWIQAFCQQTNKPLQLDIGLIYLNSSSFRALLDCIKGVKALKEQGYQIQINWHYPHNDLNDMQEEGEDMAFDAGVEFNFVED